MVSLRKPFIAESFIRQRENFLLASIDTYLVFGEDATWNDRRGREGGEGGKEEGAGIGGEGWEGVGAGQ